jgi:hypothetical protein
MKITKTYLNHLSKSNQQFELDRKVKEKWPAHYEQTIDQHLTIGSKAKNPSRDKVIS